MNFWLGLVKHSDNRTMSRDCYLGTSSCSEIITDTVLEILGLAWSYGSIARH
jgi:hypothetical protein